MSRKNKGNTVNALTDLGSLVGESREVTSATLVIDGKEVRYAKPEAPEVEASEQAKLSALARCYISDAVQSAIKVPSLKLKADYRVELLVRRNKLLDALKSEGTEAGAVVQVVQDLAREPENGLFDAQKLLQAVMGQALWCAAVDTSRYFRTENQLTESEFDADQANGVPAEAIGRDGAPCGLEGAADNEDAIMGFVGEQEEAPIPTYTEIVDALNDVHIWINIVGSAATLLPIPFTVENVGHNARGKVLYRQIESAAEAIELQQARNAKAMQRRNAEAAAKAIADNALRFAAATAMAA